MKQYSSILIFANIFASTAFGAELRGHASQESEQHPAYNNVTRKLTSDLACTEIHRRPIFGFGNDDPVNVSRDGGWVQLTKPYGPFGYEAEDPAPRYVRKWRIYSVYWDENSGGSTNVQIKFELPGPVDPVFTLPRIAGGYGWRADGYSDWFQFGSGLAQDTDKGHGVAYVRLDSTAPYNNNGNVQWVEIVAYDCIF